MNEKDYLKDISDIKNIMNRSTRFLSLSGLSGILAGMYALIGGYIAYTLIKDYGRGYEAMGDVLPVGILEIILIGIALLIAILSLVTGLILTKRKAKKNNEKVWTPASKQLFSSFLIPMIAGGAFIILMIYRGYYGLVAPATLIFYGLALYNASKHTLSQIKYLGFMEIALGVLAMIFFGNGLLFWALGFGVLHIIYGAMMHFMIDKKKG